jgi:NAD-dependent deacetylase
MIDDEISEIAERLARASRVLFITGAGISADSGLPTYRGTGGLYHSDDTEDGLPIEVALSGEVFRQRPDITWKYLQQIEEHCRGAQPNAAHRVIADLEYTIPDVIVFTQNVDGFHVAAGSTRVLEVHGNLRHLICTRCEYSARVETYAELVIPPRCPACGGIVRPDVVLFGEALPSACLDTLEREMDEGFDLVFSVGTSSLFPYIAAPVVWAAECGIPSVEINPEETPVSGVVDFRVRHGAADALSAIWQALTDR